MARESPLPDTVKNAQNVPSIPTTTPSVEHGVHAPDRPGYWMHPEKGTFELSPDEHHRDFFFQHPELVKPHPPEAIAAHYYEGWISIRKWAGTPGEWRVVCADLTQSRSTIQRWALNVLDRWPEDADVPLVVTIMRPGCTFRARPPVSGADRPAGGSLDIDSSIQS